MSFRNKLKKSINSKNQYFPLSNVYLNMNFNEDLTDPEKIDEEIKDWVSSAKKELKIQSFQKGLIYNYDFFEDRPIKNAYSRLLWDLTPIISPKSIPARSSSASQAKSSMSTAVAMD